MKSRKSSIHILAAACVCASLAGCIKDDIPYPHIQPNFLTFNVVGQDRGTQIDSASRSVTVYLPETVDIENVAVESYTITPGASIASGALPSTLNLTEPYEVTLSLYQDYVWTIAARQTIERYMTLSAQVGTSEIDPASHTVTANIASRADIASVLVESLKLGPEGSTMSPDLQGQRVDFSSPVTVDVTAWGRTTSWTITVGQVEADITTLRVDAWTSVAWVYGEGQTGREMGVEYRLQGDEQWTRLAPADITVDGGSFYGRIIHLQPLTSYEARTYSGQNVGETMQFTTGSAPQVPNASLDSWWQDGKVWCPWAEGGEQWWDTGNKGATTIGQSNSVPTTDTSTGEGWAAKLETKFVGIGPLGKLAAGNLFAGRYVRTDGTNGILSFGRPFTERPTKLRGYFKYTTAEINYASTEWQSLKGQPDTCVVWCALIDQDEPFEIRTNPKNRQLFDENGPYVVAYGRMETGQTVENYIPFEVELNYKSTQRVPKYILITCSASKYGDYFTGGNGAVLYVDDFALDYDY